MTIRFIDELDDFQGKRIFIRVDFNTPMDKEGRITDDFRIRRALPTIQLALEKNAAVIVASHMGRPKGEFKEELSLKPVGTRLSELLGQEVKMAPDCIGPEVKELVSGLTGGEVLMLENLRFHNAEKKNDPEFSELLGNMADVYINDAFACAHRAHASIDGITNYVSTVAGGFLMKSEQEFFNKSMKDPVRPLVAIIGGAKVSSKLGVLENMMEKVDKLIIGGAMAFSFLKAQGRQVGKSKVEDDMLDQAKRIIALAAEKNVEFLLPVDVVVAEKPEAGAETRVVSVDEIPVDDMGLDIGPESVQKFHDALLDAKTVVWNGPMGLFEIEDFAGATMEMAHFLGKSAATVIIGGGDTDKAVHAAGEVENVDYISTGGGAFLEMMEGRELPGFKALDK